MRSVCVIGAGVAGILAARYLRKHFKVTILEASSFMGGVWLYDKDAQGKATPMYKNLKTNLPKQLMVFRDLEHDNEQPTFMDHYQVLSYLESYCDKFDIRSLIKFNTRVNHVKPDLSEDTMKWSVHTDSGAELQYDAVAVCPGRYDIPYIPDIEGIEVYHGKYMHSKDYKVPEPYRNKKVLVVGHRASAVDLALDLHVHGAECAISHRKGELLQGFPDALLQYPEPVKFDKKNVYFKDGSCMEFDMIIFATGYKTNLDFIDPSCGVTVETLPRPLYKYFINPTYPSMMIGDQLQLVAPFPACEYQGLYFRELLLGNVNLPNKQQRLEQANGILTADPDVPLKYKYALHLDQFPYYSQLAEDCKISVEGPFNFTALHDLYRDVWELRSENPLTYRRNEICFNEDTNKFDVVN